MEKQELVNKHQKEKGSLQSEFTSLRTEKEELHKAHQKEKGDWEQQSTALCAKNEAMQQKLQQLEKELVRSVLIRRTF